MTTKKSSSKMPMRGPMQASMMNDPYQAEDDARTLKRAEEIKLDRKRHAAAKKHLSKDVTAAKRALATPEEKGMPAVGSRKGR